MPRMKATRFDAPFAKIFARPFARRFARPFARPFAVLFAMRFAVLFALLFVVVPNTAHAQKPVTAGASVPRGTVIHLRLQSGSVKLSGWPFDSVHVSGMLAPGESWAMRADGDTMRLRADGIPRGLAAPSELEIFVPMSSPLIVRAAAASLVVRDFDVSVDVATAAGNLLVEAVRGPVRAETMQGTLTVLGPIPRVDASTASGALLVSVPYDTINDVVYEQRTTSERATPFSVVLLRSVSGRITFDSPAVDSAIIHNVRGDVRVITSPTASGRVHVTSHVGRVIVGWTDKMRANVDALTQKGGVRGRVPVNGAPPAGAAAQTTGNVAQSAGDAAPSSAGVDVSTLMRRTPLGVAVSYTFGRSNDTRPGPFTVRAVRGELVFERVDVRPAP